MRAKQCVIAAEDQTLDLTLKRQEASDSDAQRQTERENVVFNLTSRHHFGVYKQTERKRIVFSLTSCYHLGDYSGPQFSVSSKREKKNYGNKKHSENADIHTSKHESTSKEEKCLV